jgi:hypothetical protein
LQPFSFPLEELDEVAVDAPVAFEVALVVVVVTVGFDGALPDGWHWEYHSLTNLQLFPASHCVLPVEAEN